MAYIEGVDRHQQVLLPESIDDYVPEDHPVRFIDAFVRGLDMQALGFVRAVPAAEGRPGYNPRDLLALFIYGYLNRTRSSRRLEAETHRNLEVIWLMRKLRPDHKTIAQFRRVHGEALKRVCREFTLLCKDLELFGSALVFLDGSKLRAVNNRDRNFSAARLKKLLTRIDRHIDTYLRELEARDARDQAEPVTTNLKEKIAALEARKARYTAYQAQLEESGESQLSLTDPESRRMKVRGDYDVCYNAQIAVDAKHHLIVAHDVTNEVTDLEQLEPMARAAKEALGVETLEVCADRGYHNGAQVVNCEEEDILPYVPAPETSKAEKAGLFSKEHFRYVPEEDAYRCPAGQWLPFATQENRDGRIIRYFANRAACAACPLREQCTQSKSGRRIFRTPEEDQVEAMRKRVEQRRDLMIQRKATVEHPFGTLKRCWDSGYFLMRGLAHVQAEFSLSVLAYNLRRAINVLGVECLLEELKQRAKLRPKVESGHLCPPQGLHRAVFRPLGLHLLHFPRQDAIRRRPEAYPRSLAA
jgi:transposase